MSEEEKRLHRCCFTGHRPEKISATEEEVKAWLEEKIDQAIADGYTTFISGYAMGDNPGGIVKSFHPVYNPCIR